MRAERDPGAAASSPPERVDRPPAKGPGKGFILLVGSLAALAPLSIDLYLPAFPEMARDLDASPAAIQLTLTTYLIGHVGGVVLGGPLSDAHGRRRPVLVALVVYTVISAASVFATSALMLAALRLVQGLAAGSAMVIGPAFVRDIAAGRSGARLLSWVLGVGTIAPVVGPLIGSQLLQLGSWRIVFAVPAIFGFVCGLICLRALPETLRPALRRSGALGDTMSVVRRLRRDADFVALTVASGLFGATFVVYLSASSTVFQSVFGLSPQQYGLAFAINAVGYLMGVQVSARVLRRHSSWWALRAGLVVGTIAGLVLLGVSLSGGAGFAGVAVPLFIILACHGVVYPNATALALTRYPDAAGTATTAIMAVQLGTGAVASSLVGIGGLETAIPLSIATAALTSAGLLVFVLRLRPRMRAETRGDVESHTGL